ncbi:hypothetical protein AC249_AIPGENE28698, partial [Exaiptasia diaphana]
MEEIEMTGFDPTTEQGRRNLDQTFDEEHDKLIKQDDETIEEWESKGEKRFGSKGFNYLRDRLTNMFKKKGPVPEYLKIADLNEEREREDRKEEAKRQIDKLFSQWKDDELIYGLNEKGEALVKIKVKKGLGVNNKWHTLRNYEDFEKLPKTLKKLFIRSTADDIEYTECKEALDARYPKNKLPDTWNGDLDIGWDDGELSIYDKKSNKWNKLDA